MITLRPWFAYRLNREPESLDDEEVPVTICATCGNDYEKAFTVTWPDGRAASFDSVECASVQLAPECAHCRCRILGHGVETNAGIYCCAHCAREVSGADIKDRDPVPAGA